jgi:hypothetical protein
LLVERRWLWWLLLGIGKVTLFAFTCGTHGIILFIDFVLFYTHGCGVYIEIAFLKFGRKKGEFISRGKGILKTTRVTLLLGLAFGFGIYLTFGFWSFLRFVQK